MCINIVRHIQMELILNSELKTKHPAITRETLFPMSTSAPNSHGFQCYFLVRRIFSSSSYVPFISSPQPCVGWNKDFFSCNFRKREYWKEVQSTFLLGLVRGLNWKLEFWVLILIFSLTIMMLDNLSISL